MRRSVRLVVPTKVPWQGTLNFKCTLHVNVHGHALAGLLVWTLQILPACALPAELRGSTSAKKCPRDEGSFANNFHCGEDVTRRNTRHQHDGKTHLRLTNAWSFTRVALQTQTYVSDGEKKVVRTFTSCPKRPLSMQDVPQMMTEVTFVFLLRFCVLMISRGNESKSSWNRNV